jgi:KUP system potassium uptake protein
MAGALSATTTRDVPHAAHTAGAATLTLAALGVVFGDIGTSPLYSMHEVFAGDHPITPTNETIYGVVSMIVWALMIIVTLKYVLVIMRANNNGEGGIMALIALVRRAVQSPNARYVLVALGLFGASLFYGDGMITPAISVLSAVEGLKVASPSLSSEVIPISLAVLTVLFCIQRFGTGRVGALFGPMMGVWFTTIGVLGVYNIATDAAIFRCLSPSYAAQFIIDSPHQAFVSLGSVVLAVTGAEALYADMGHFGRPAIARAWLGLVYPALILNYLGQGALLLDDHSATRNPFFLLAPDWFQLPLVILATIATVIASQAVIAGAFSVTRQAVQLGYLPRVAIRHTSREEGQIYVPVVNWLLFVAIVGLVLGFRSSSNLAAAYGIAVTGTLAIDTVLAFVVVRLVWKKSWPLVILGAGGFLFVDLSFFAGNVSKIPHGGWFPLLIGALVFGLLMTWRRGRITLADRTREDGLQLRLFINRMIDERPLRIPGTAVFMTAGDNTPRALQQDYYHHHVLYERIVILRVHTVGVPHVADSDRVEVTQARFGFVRVTARYGFQDEPDIPEALRLANEHGAELDLRSPSYFLSRIQIVPTKAKGMNLFRKHLFVALQKNAVPAARYYRLPAAQVVDMGSYVEI